MHFWIERTINCMRHIFNYSCIYLKHHLGSLNHIWNSNDLMLLIAENEREIYQNKNTYIFLFVCLFGVYRPTWRIAGEGLQILTYTRHSWPLSILGSLACHAYCDTGHPFIMVISEDPWHSHLLPSVKQWKFHYLFLGLSRLGFAHSTFRSRGQRSNPLLPPWYKLV